jgi:nitrite reductase/ring-hydroxylating ferredoxin subunit
LEHKVATVAQIPPGSIKEVTVDDVRYALYNVDGEILASFNRCPHAGAPLSQGFLEDGAITCPLHMWGFDVRTGECLTDPDWSSLQTFPVRVAEGVVYLFVSEQ